MTSPAQPALTQSTGARDRAGAGSGASPVLAVNGLEVTFQTRDGPLKAVTGVSYEIEPGRTLGVPRRVFATRDTQRCRSGVGSAPACRGRPPPGTISTSVSRA